MTASNMLIGRGQDGDNNSCVCPLLRTFIIITNDAMPERILGEVYGPLVWEVLGTRTDDPAVLMKRMFVFIERADAILQSVRCSLIASLGCSKYMMDAKVFAAEVKDYAEWPGCMEVWFPELEHKARRPISYIGRVMAHLIHMENHTSTNVCHTCADIIREVAAIGDKRPVECAISQEVLADALSPCH